MSQDLQNRKRFRITLVCNVCKSRKVKCDRKSPCTSCIKHNTSNICSYDEQVWISQLPHRDNTNLGFGTGNGNQSNVGRINSNSSDSNGSPPIHSEVTELREKLSRLEKLIVSTNQYNINDIVDVKLALDSFTDFNSVVGINPIATNDDTLNLYSNFGTIRTDKSEYSKRIDYAPFTFHGLLRRDPCLLDVWYYITQKRANLTKKIKENGNAIPIAGGIAGNKRSVNIKDSNHKSVLMKIRRYLERKFNPKKLSSSISSPGIVLQSSSPGAEISAVSANEEILHLPPSEVIWGYVDNFFSKLYQYFPYVEENDFRDNISKILQSRTNSSPAPSPRLQSKKDFAILGQLYVVLRMSYLSTVSRSEYAEHQKFLNNISSVNSTNSNPSSSNSSPASSQHFSMYPIGVEYVDCAKRCLNCFDLLQPIDINIVQCSLLLCLYLQIAPEDGEGPDRNQFQIYIGILVQMALSTGLNRDPNKFQEFSVSESQNHLRRKIWNQIVQLDLFSSTLFGNAPNIQRKYYDTLYPYYSIGCEGISSNPSLEREIIELHKPREVLVQKTKLMVESILQVTEDVKLRSISNYLSEVEIIMRREFGSLSEYRESDPRFVLNMNMFIQLRIFHTSLYFELFLYYEREKNVDLMFFYFKKTISVILEEYSPLLIDLALSKDNTDPVKDDKFSPEKMMLYPGLEQIAHRKNGLLFSMLLRMKYTLHLTVENRTGKNGAEKKNYYTELEKLSQLLMLSVKGTVVGISQINDMYWFAWRIAKAHSYIFNVICSDEYYATIDEYEREKSIPTIIFSVSQIKELRTMIDRLLLKYRKRGIGYQWGLVSDVSEATKSEEVRESSTDLDGPTVLDFDFNSDIDDIWNNFNFNNIQNHIGLSNEDFSSVLELKEFKDVMDNYFDLDEPFYNSFSHFTNT